MPKAALTANTEAGNTLAHDVDVMVQVEKGVASPTKSRIVRLGTYQVFDANTGHHPAGTEGQDLPFPEAGATQTLLGSPGAVPQPDAFVADYRQRLVAYLLEDEGYEGLPKNKTALEAYAAEYGHKADCGRLYLF